MITDTIFRLTNSDQKNNMCISDINICNGRPDCFLGDDEYASLCEGKKLGSSFCIWKYWNGHPASFIRCDLSDQYKYVISNALSIFASHFSLANHSIRPSPSVIPPTILKTVSTEDVVEDEMINEHLQSQTTPILFHCHGGIPVNFLPNKSTSSRNESEKRCLCPPTLYGAQCENHRQRITVTLQIASFLGQIPFTFVAYLLDDKYHTVQSFHQIHYLSIRDCGTKFSFHLLYSSRSKAPNSSYSVRIDAFETKTLHYRASWTYPLIYSFLPVYRLSLLLGVPVQLVTPEHWCPLKCSPPHGECAIYINTGQFFCRCKRGWFGSLCTYSYKCDCSPDSVCVGSWNNRSICICPLRKFGPRCYITSDVCKNRGIVACLNNGECIPSDVRITSDRPTACICPVGFHNTYCQSNQTRINMFFGALPTQNIPPQVLLHFIIVRTHPSPYGPAFDQLRMGST